MRPFCTFLLLLCISICQAQTASVKGQLQEANGEAVVFANVALYNSADNSLVKVETTNESGLFQIQGIQAGTYDLIATYVGLPDLKKTAIELKADDLLDMGVLAFTNASVELSEVTVTASRAIVEVKPDRTVFNVEGTINSVGSDALSLLRKAPGVTVDNNDNVSVLGRSGVLVYVDGKRLPITGEDLSSYLQNLQASQIDRIDIITSPGAKYEAEGNAGIIDIRLKRDKSHGANGSANATASQGRYGTYNAGINGNFRNKKMNVFAQLSGAKGKRFNDMSFYSRQNGLVLDEEINMVNEFENFNYRIGTDFFLGKNHTLGFLIGGIESERIENNSDRIKLSKQTAPTAIDSILVADNTANTERSNNSFNINYSYRQKDRNLNIDLDYGNYERESVRFQPNQYFDATESIPLTRLVNSFDTPTDIDIYTGKIDYEQNLLGGRLSFGSKLSRVVSDNTFLVFDVLNGEEQQNNNQSNSFRYTENVYAGYVNFSRPINEKWNFSAGLRAEQTDAVGNLTAFEEDKQEPPVELNYLSWFPSAGLTWQVAPMHSLALNYGRRINRPDYNVLNPFRNQLSQLSFERGNPVLQPEIVNNIELGYTLKYRYNFKIAYSKTTDQITRLISPDADNPQAGFITWDNLANQTVISANISAPVQVTKWWNAYINISASHLDNQASYTDSTSNTDGQVFYSDSAIVDVQAFTYSIFQQHTFTLPWGLKGEISGYFAGPGVWGGVFRYESNWSLNIGIQRKFFQDKLNVRVSANDLFYQSGWDGVSEFNGLVSEGSGRWDSRRVSLSLNYRFGNQNVKSRKRKTGIEDEAGRVSN